MGRAQEEIIGRRILRHLVIPEKELHRKIFIKLSTMALFFLESNYFLLKWFIAKWNILDKFYPSHYRICGEGFSSVK